MTVIEGGIDVDSSAFKASIAAVGCFLMLFVVYLLTCCDTKITPTDTEQTSQQHHAATSPAATSTDLDTSSSRAKLFLDLMNRFYHHNVVRKLTKDDFLMIFSNHNTSITVDQEEPSSSSSSLNKDSSTISKKQDIIIREDDDHNDDTDVEKGNTKISRKDADGIRGTTNSTAAAAVGGSTDSATTPKNDDDGSSRQQQWITSSYQSVTLSLPEKHMHIAAAVNHQDEMLSTIDASESAYNEDHTTCSSLAAEEEKNAVRLTTNEHNAPNQCAICLKEYEIDEQIVWSPNEDCTHAYHLQCLLSWLVKSDLKHGAPCPCCRNDFLGGEENHQKNPSYSSSTSSTTAHNNDNSQSSDDTVDV